VLFLLPCPLEEHRGNTTTANRLAEELGRRGYEVSQREAAAVSPDEPPCADLIVGLHAMLSGPQAAQLAKAWKVPYLILFTGTDLNGKPSAQSKEILQQADAVVALGRSAARRARDLYPDLGDLLHTIPQGVTPIAYRPGLRLPDSAPAHDSATPIVLLPAGMRAIKDPMRAVDALTPLQREIPDLQLWLLGPVLEPACGDALAAKAKELPWVYLLGAHPRAELLPFYRRANVVLSTSKSEGGAPNALLEAALIGRPVLASSIPAHREFPGPEHCFRDDRELRKRLREILDQPDQAMLAARKLQEIVRQAHSPAAESLAWDRLLRPLRPAQA
jgi:glycosyltransferase involved in cell wall biosynthesis